MGRWRSGIIWFDDEKYIGSEITFQQPHHSSWKLEQKIIEHEYCYDGEDIKAGLIPEARAVFTCRSLDGSSKEAIMKIKKQIPYSSTIGKSSSARARQATDTLSSGQRLEIEALEILTKAGCSSTPSLLAWKEEKQDQDSWVPGGCIIYILMEKLPGITVDNFYGQLDREERDEMRRSFKEAWLECRDCGVVNMDDAIRNLLWDRENKKCYIIDFEMWFRPKEGTVWHDYKYIGWNLAYTDQEDLYDMSTWQL
ncbi:hypothetical protein B7463_g6961, partial [Scytalidium lignicola]